MIAWSVALALYLLGMKATQEYIEMCLAYAILDGSTHELKGLRGRWNRTSTILLWPVLWLFVLASGFTLDTPNAREGE